MRRVVLVSVAGVAALGAPATTEAHSLVEKHGVTSPTGVRQFQRSHGLLIDGVVGHQTAQCVLGRCAGVVPGPLTAAERQALGLAPVIRTVRQAPQQRSYQPQRSYPSQRQYYPRRVRTYHRASRTYHGSYQTTPRSGGGGHLAAIRRCESGGNYRAVSPSSQYRGAYQFDRATWRSVGGSGDPAAASPAEQDKRASMLYARTGGASWPVCGK
jgi:hypothetical protein